MHNSTIYQPISPSRHRHVDKATHNEYMFSMKTLRGFSMVEMTVTLAIMLIVVSIAAPQMTTLIKEFQLQSQFDKFIIAMNYARSEAIKRNQSVVLCPRVDASTCGALTWENGWLIYADVVNPGVLDAGDTILKQQIELPTGFSVRATAGSTFENNVTYTRTGITGVGDNFVLCDSRGFLGAETRIMSISPTGRAESIRNEPPDLAVPYTDCLGN